MRAEKVLMTGLLVLGLLIAIPAHAKTPVGTKSVVTKQPISAAVSKAKKVPVRRSGTKNFKRKPQNYSLLADYKYGPHGGHGHADPFNRRLASGNPGADLQHYQNLKRRLGIDLGLMLPFGSFSNVASLSPMIGLHFVWEAIPPFSFTVNYRRSSADNKTTPGTSKLSVNYISVGAQASFPSGRFVPFVKLEGGLFFNDYRQNGITATTGDDALLTSLGASAGLGFDFVVGREVSIGFDAMYHYAVKKNIALDGTNFNLGSSFATFGFRLNF